MIDYEYEAWKGNIGPGALLRESIARDNEERMATKAKAAPVSQGIKIDADVIALMNTGTWTTTDQGDAAFTMPMTSDRKLYQKTAKVLEALGGKWNRKAQATVFADDADAEVAVREALLSGEYVDSKKLFQFFETPEEVAGMMIKNLCLHPGMKYTVLEPNAGHGALINIVAKQCTTDGPDVELVAIELDQAKEVRLREFCGGTGQITKRVLISDFLAYRPDHIGMFDRVIMNPPFTRGQDMAHVRHAYDFLVPNGLLVAIMSPAFTYRSDKASAEFRNWLSELEGFGYATYVPLPEGSFKASGTNVRTVMVTIKRRKG